MLKIEILGLIALPCAMSFPWMAEMQGLNRDMLNANFELSKRQTAPGCYAASCCPNNPKHPGAAPLTSQFPYLGAKGGVSIGSKTLLIIDILTELTAACYENRQHRSPYGQ